MGLKMALKIYDLTSFWMSLRRRKGTERKLQHPVLSLCLILAVVRNKAWRSVLRTYCYVMLCLQMLDDVSALRMLA